MSQVVAIKQISTSSPLEIQAEAKISLKVRGSPYFPYFYGMVFPDKLVYELVGSGSAITLKEVIAGKSLSLGVWCDILMDISKALHSLHNLGILHNDLHTCNILVRSKKHVKIIDFGKSCLISDPVVYNIKVGTDKHKKYNTFHRHLAHELRNIPGSSVSTFSDIYTLGYVFNSVSQVIKSETLVLLSDSMMNLITTERPDLPKIFYGIGKCKRK